MNRFSGFLIVNAVLVCADIGEAEIEQQKKQMLQDVRSEISELAVDIASKVVEREINQKDYDGFVDDFIQNVGERS